MDKKKVLLIGWDGADWKYLDPLLKKGLMPNLQKLIDGGVRGSIRTKNNRLKQLCFRILLPGN